MLNKIGNAGSRAARIEHWQPYMLPTLQAIDDPVDLYILNLGTNDQRAVDSPPERTIALMLARAAAVRQHSPHAGVVFVVPPYSTPSGVKPGQDLSAYRDRYYRAALEHGYEFLNMLDTFGPFAATEALGQYVDPSHLNAAGAFNYAAVANQLLRI